MSSRCVCCALLGLAMFVVWWSGVGAAAGGCWSFVSWRSPLGEWFLLSVVDVGVGRGVCVVSLRMVVSGLSSGVGLAWIVGAVDGCCWLVGRCVCVVRVLLWVGDAFVSGRVAW